MRRAWTRIAPPVVLLLAIGVLYWGALQRGFLPRWSLPSVEPARQSGTASAGPAGSAVATPRRPAGSADLQPSDTGVGTENALGSSAPPARARGIRLDFETAPSGRPACGNCALDGQFAAVGIRFAFHSWTADGTRAHWLDGSRYLPAGRAGVHGVAGAVGPRGMEVGVVRVEFLEPVPRVVFRLIGPELVERFHVTAYGPAGPLPDAWIRRDSLIAYTARSGSRFRSARVSVHFPGGIRRIELDGFGPPGHVLFLDDLEF